MAIASFSNLTTRFFYLHTYTHTQNNIFHYNHPSITTFTITTRSGTFIFFSSKLKRCSAPIFTPTNFVYSPIITVFSSGNSGGASGSGGSGGGRGGGGGEEEERDRNREEALLVLAEAGRSLESFTADLAAAVMAGRVPGSIVRRFLELEKSVVFRWLLKFGGFKERLLADDLFLTKLVMECVVVIFTKAMVPNTPDNISHIASSPHLKSD